MNTDTSPRVGEVIQGRAVVGVARDGSGFETVTSPIYDVVTFGTEYRAICRACGATSQGYARDYQAISAGSVHGCRAAGIASVFSGVIR